MKNMERRDFLRLTLATAAMPVLLGAGTKAWALVNRQMLTGDQLLTLGYWQGSEGMLLLQPESTSVETLSLTTDGVALGEVPRPARLTNRLIDASRLTSGDSGLIKYGCRLTIHGMTGLDRVNTQPVSLQVLSQVVGVKEPLPWQIWSYQGGPAQNISSAISASVPISHGRLELELTLGEAEPRVVRLPIITGRGSGQPKLRRGVYLLAVQSRPGQLLPNWRFSRMHPDVEQEPSAGNLDFSMQTVVTGQPQYLVFSVDYADAVISG